MAAKDALFKHFCILSVVFLLINHGICLPKDEDRKVYIVYLGSLNPTETYSPTSQHLSLLQQVVKDQRSASASLIRSYQRSINGFAAKLTEKEAQKLASKDEVFVGPVSLLYGE
ncbi:subtilisin-like protease SBT4.6 [Punica granatum]|uniref:Subtilisin-like protease SBT4.6 n=1 Tax=Punica granatum TaxID=22663 RepID=A0A6P8CUI3_PUNGR|nr:subtilisin-like protease SBT4.6 [Punica granatum]